MSGWRAVLRISCMVLLGGTYVAAAGDASPPIAGGKVSPMHLIVRASVQPNVLDVRGDTWVMIRYELASEATVIVDLVDDQGRIVRRLSPGRQQSGERRLTCNGRTEDGNAVSSGAYRSILRASRPNGNEDLYDPSDQTGGENCTWSTYLWIVEPERCVGPCPCQPASVCGLGFGEGRICARCSIGSR